MSSADRGRRTDVFILRQAIDLDTVDDLARLALEVKRKGARLAILAAPYRLVGLIEQVGLAELVGVAAELRWQRPSEAGGEAEPLEE